MVFKYFYRIKINDLKALYKKEDDVFIVYDEPIGDLKDAVDTLDNFRWRITDEKPVTPPKIVGVIHINNNNSLAVLLGSNDIIEGFEVYSNEHLRSLSESHRRIASKMYSTED